MCMSVYTCVVVYTLRILMLMASQESAFESALPTETTVHLTRTAVFEHVTASASASATLAATVLPIPSTSTSARALPTEPSSLQTTDPSPDPIPVGAVIGLVIGISMFVVIVLFLAISCIWKQRGIVEVGQPRQGLKRVGSRSGLAANAASPATGGRGF